MHMDYMIPIYTVYGPFGYTIHGRARIYTLRIHKHLQFFSPKS